ncbi:cyclin-dependent kinase inhibitor 1B-like [Carcharodon carcharias]|uniref:cyclin-dependent kinase inhibitor 1B-like n=1 Tax=Carcharodon carcharias TaxID=13397 RepID=UPI001B7E3727|nr:cyclin-dependent kinase inhibitor 1B-like [Carcharodon carcharias]
MSHLSSLTVEESEGKMQPRYLNKAVCKSLFGAVDHDELRRDLKKQLKEIKKSHCQRWNFDFENHNPLTGNYIWEAFDTRDLPSFYRNPSPSLPVTPDTRCDLEATRRLESSGKAKTNGANNRKNRAKAPRNRKREIPAPITDFFPKRKRIVGSKQLIPRIRTPRKRIR